MIKKIILGTILFLATFILTAYFVNVLNNSGMDSVSKETDAPTLPIVYCEYNDMVINPMFGYTQNMSTGQIRDVIIPMDSTHMVTLLVDDESEFAESYSYELRTISGDSLIEEGELRSVGEKNGYTAFDISIRMDLKLNQEYVLVFIMKNEKSEFIKYYTRVVSLSSEHTSDIIAYAKEFHNATFVKNIGEEGNMVSDALTGSADGSDYDLSHVDLNTSYDMISWGNLAPLLSSPMIPAITEVESGYAVIHFAFTIVSTNGKTSYNHNVDEYYTALYNEDSNTVEILAFDRYIDTLFSDNNKNAVTNTIDLGITAQGDYNYMFSDSNRKVAIAKAGELWLYNYRKSEMVNVFSYRKDNFEDIRCINDNIEVSINSIDDDGNIYFTVFGYMNRGEHEGKNGISFYYFNAIELSLQEILFVQVDEPYDVMKDEVGRFSYYDGESKYYYLLDDVITCINIKDLTTVNVTEPVPTDRYYISENRMIAVYPKQSEKSEVTELAIHNFETNEEFIESCTADERLLPLGFVENDFIFGIAKKTDIITTADGNTVLPLYEIKISNSNGEVIKTYSDAGVYVMDAEVEADRIYLTRYSKLNNFFEETEPDYIIYNSENDLDEINDEIRYSDILYNQVALTVASDMYLTNDATLVVTTNAAYDNYTEFEVKTTQREKAFYIFTPGSYLMECESAGRAITEVQDYDSAVVVDDNGNMIYRTLVADSYNTVLDHIYEQSCSNVQDSLMTCIYMCVNYAGNGASYEEVMSCESWEDAFEQYTFGIGVDISGVSLDTALYFLDRDVPFIAEIDTNYYVLVGSYNSTHIRYYDPVIGEEVKVTRESFNESLSTHSNTMYTYTSQ